MGEAYLHMETPWLLPVMGPLLSQSLRVKFKPHGLRINKCGFLWRCVGLLPEAQMEDTKKVKPVGSHFTLNIEWMDKGPLVAQVSSASSANNNTI